LAAVTFLQLLVYGYQAKKLRETVESAEGQSRAMERHIGEAARSANAMETIAAYVSVAVGGCDLSRTESTCSSAI